VAHVPPANFARARLSQGFENLMRAGSHLRGCHDCWSHAMAARGALDALVELGLNRWDIAATQVIVEEAGGACRIRPSHYGPGKFDVVLGNVRAVDEVAALIGFDRDPAA
jgi:histidinol-phosphatase